MQEKCRTSRHPGWRAAAGRASPAPTAVLIAHSRQRRVCRRRACMEQPGRRGRRRRNEMRHVLLATAAIAVLAGATAACGPIDTSAQSYHAYDGAATPSYGASGSAMAAAGGRNGDSGWLGGLTVISPNDPAYSYSEPPHRGQSTMMELNGDDGGRGTSYPAIIGRDSNGRGGRAATGRAAGGGAAGPPPPPPRPP